MVPLELHTVKWNSAGFLFVIQMIWKTGIFHRGNNYGIFFSFSSTISCRVDMANIMLKKHLISTYDCAIF